MHETDVIFFLIRKQLHLSTEIPLKYLNPYIEWNKRIGLTERIQNVLSSYFITLIESYDNIFEIILKLQCLWSHNFGSSR